MLVQLYEKFRQTLDAMPQTGRFMPYDWVSLPTTIDAMWMPYFEMLTEFSRELANIINDFTHYVQWVQTWAVVIAPMSDKEKLDATHEFIDVLGTIAVNLPYVIRSRLIFATAHLCHQANIVKEPKSWKDNLALDEDIYMAVAECHGYHWRKFNPLKLRIEAIGGREYRRATHDFRNAYNHRFSPRFVVGITSFVVRNVDKSTGRVSYGFGGIPALDLTTLSDLLVKERDRCYTAFGAFQNLVCEQERAIKQHGQTWRPRP